jgi:hypothetical protein
MKAFLLATLVNALRLYVGAGLYDRLAAEVGRLSLDTSLTGGAKMSQVIAFAGREMALFSETLVRVVAEVALLRLKDG